MISLKRLALAFLIALPCWAAAKERPNVLFISVDDLNDFAQFSGRYPDAKTPHMDRLAEQGMVFTRAHAQYPLCGPSRASVMTGLLPSTLGYDTHMKDETLVQQVAEMDTELLRTYFSKHGYKTMAVGKIFHRHVPEGTVDASGGRGEFNEAVNARIHHVITVE